MFADLNEIFAEFPVLETNRLKLIRITETHTQDMYEIFSNEKVMEFYDIYPHKAPKESLKLIHFFENRFQAKMGIRWGIVRKNDATQKLIGTIGYNGIRPNIRGVIGYDLNEAVWNQGIITEAIQCVIDYGFKTLNLHRIEAEVIPANKASQVVLEKNGFVKEGTLRDKAYWKEQFTTVFLYSKLVTD